MLSVNSISCNCRPPAIDVSDDFYMPTVVIDIQYTYRITISRDGQRAQSLDKFQTQTASGALITVDSAGEEDEIRSE